LWEVRPRVPWVLARLLVEVGARAQEIQGLGVAPLRPGAQSGRGQPRRLHVPGPVVRPGWWRPRERSLELLQAGQGLARDRGLPAPRGTDGAGVVGDAVDV